MARLPAVVAVSLTGFTAVHSDVTNLTTPVTFHLITKFLDVTKASTGVALLLVGMVAVAGHVASFAAGVAELLPLPLGLLAVPGNVTTPVAVVACILGLVAVPGHVSLVSTPITEELFGSSPAPTTSARTAGIGAILHPMTGTATSKAITAHIHRLHLRPLMSSRFDVKTGATSTGQVLFKCTLYSLTSSGT